VLPENTVHCIDAVAGLRQLPADTIPMTLTSPAYGAMRTYGGHTWNFQATVRELYRVTMPAGIVVWVVQDQTKFIGEAFRQALAFQNVGFHLYETLIMARLETRLCPPRRFGLEPEFAFVFCKGKRPRAGIPTLLRDKPNRTAGQRKKACWTRDPDGSRRRSGRYSITIAPCGVRGNIWTYNVGKNKTSADDLFDPKTGHPAVMPEQMAEDLILAWSKVNDLVLDIFAGSGTTLKMAALNQRKFLGFDISAKYVRLAERRLKKHGLLTPGTGSDRC
jgi:site-specific DNA-methyltransferase (adenine-specific)